MQKAPDAANNSFAGQGLLSIYVCKILAFYFCSSSHAMICLLFSYPITFRSVMKIGFSKSAKVTELMLLNLLDRKSVV